MSFLQLAQDIDTSTEVVAKSTSAVDRAAQAIEQLKATHLVELEVLTKQHQITVAKADEDRKHLQDLCKSMHQLMAGTGYNREDNVERPLKPQEPSGSEMKALALAAQTVRPGFKR